MVFFEHKYRYIFIAALSVYTYLSTVFCGVYEAFGIQISWYTALGSITAITLATWECSRLLVKKMVPTSSHQGKTLQRLILFFAISTTACILFTTLIVYSFDSFFDHPELNLLVPLKLTITYAVLINLLFHLLHAVAFYMDRYKNKQLEAEELLRMNTQAQMQSIKAQINPHFLFNNLNVLSTLVMKGSNNANEFIEAFSKVYHYILRNYEKELVPLQQEIDFLQPYTFLLQQRFPESFFVEITLSHEQMKKFVIPVAIQMLVENAIKHNIVSKQQPLIVSISVNNMGELVVSNNVQPKLNTEPSGKIGLANINQRYYMLSGKEIGLTSNETFFSVSLPLLELNTYAGTHH